MHEHVSIARGLLGAGHRGGDVRHVGDQRPVRRAAVGRAAESPSQREWSRTRVVTELAQWLLEDPTVDAATLGRRGQNALAVAARRLFGRFDAALNAANLHLAELYPDGPPTRAKRSAAMT